MAELQPGYSDQSPINYWQDISFPITKQELINCCEYEGAPEAVIDLVTKMPERTYNSWTEVMEGVGAALSPHL